MMTVQLTNQKKKKGTQGKSGNWTMLHRRQGLLVKGKDKMIVGIVRVDSEKFNVSGLNSTDKIKWRRVIVNQLKQHHMLFPSQLLFFKNKQPHLFSSLAVGP